MEVHRPKLLIAAFLFFLALGERVVFDLGPNIELVTLVMLLSTAFLGKKHSLVLVFLIMLVSDLILGNTLIFLFTWTGFLIPIFFISKAFQKFNQLNKAILGTGLGIGSNLFFWFWTNGGVWLLDSWGMYSKDIPGLITCYFNALPFLKLQLLSTLLTVPAGFLITEILLSLQLKIFPHLAKN